MGLLDKAKQVAEQAQAKLDEVQQQFSERSGSSQQEGPAVESDEHGSPVRDEGETAPPHGDPLGEETQEQPAPPPAAPEPTGPEPPAEDSNRPSYEPPKLTGGDPLAG